LRKTFTNTVRSPTCWACQRPRSTNDDRLYRTLDAILPHKAALETPLKERLGELFGPEYDLLLYDVTGTYFEGKADGNPLAQRGYSRDHRPDCKQVCVGLGVTPEGTPVGYEVFAGNRTDVTTLEQIVTTMEGRYGRAQRIWVLDRGLVSRENLEFLQKGGQRYIVGTPKSMLKRFERELLQGDWESIREGLEVKRWGGRRASKHSFCAAVRTGRPRNGRCTNGSRNGSRRD